jgi:lipopolysaccharide transport system permease protein
MRPALTGPASITVIGPPRGGLAFDFGEIWERRDLLAAFVRRDVSVRYKQTAVGIGWAIMQPLVTMIVYTVTFGKFAHVPSDGIPYAVFAFTGLLLWTLFSTSLSSAADSLVANEGIVKKVYFPRLILPLASASVAVVDFTFSIVCFGGLLVYYGTAPHLLGLALLPLLALWTLLSSAGLGWFLAALNAKYRDVRHALPFFVQLLVFVSPVIYPTAIFHRYAWVLALNPMTGVIETARWALFGAGTVTLPVILTSLTTSTLLLIFGFSYFRRTERTLADVL